MKKYIFRINKNENGATLMEVTVGMIIFGIIGSIVVAVIANQTESFNQVLNQEVGRSDVRKAIRTMRRDIQNLSISNIATMTSGQFVFMDNDGNNVSYIKSGYNLSRNDNVILTGLAEDPFSYLNIDKTTTGVQDSVKFIGVTLNIVRNSQSVKVEEVIYARN
ncbi:MAG: type II secretion system protein [Calditrichaeota bacterium]|nr:MAG: type II secretion system protein [Calditrichota bacterium]MBL1204365.1 type II secretion system protein [Calditrichota bacterium]NOG44194.1 type II secretion system protein [Calditrichota bacterium]